MVAVGVAVVLGAGANADAGGVDGVQLALDQCTSTASSLRSIASECRADDDPGCSVTYTETSLAGQVYDYTFTPAQADDVALQFEANAVVLATELAKLREVDARVADTQAEIGRLGFTKRGDDYLAWLDLAADAKAELDEQTLDLVVDKALEAGVDGITEKLAGFSRGKADKLIKKLKQAGVDSDAVRKALKKLARVKGRRKKVAAAKVVYDELKEAWDTASALLDAATLAELAKVVLGTLVKDPRLQLLVDEVEWTTAAIYGYAAGTIAEDQIAILTSLEERDLLALKSLTELLERQVKEFKALVAPLRACSWTNP